MLTTPGGKPTSSSSFTISMTASGSWPAGRTTTVLPIASAGPSLPTMFTIGKLYDVMHATTPIGARRASAPMMPAGRERGRRHLLRRERDDGGLHRTGRVALEPASRRSGPASSWRPSSWRRSPRSRAARSPGRASSARRRRPAAARRARPASSATTPGTPPAPPRPQRAPGRRTLRAPRRRPPRWPGSPPGRRRRRRKPTRRRSAAGTSPHRTGSFSTSLPRAAGRIGPGARLEQVLIRVPAAPGRGWPRMAGWSSDASESGPATSICNRSAGCPRSRPSSRSSATTPSGSPRWPGATRS